METSYFIWFGLLNLKYLPRNVDHLAQPLANTNNAKSRFNQKRFHVELIRLINSNYNTSVLNCHVFDTVSKYQKQTYIYWLNNIKLKKLINYFLP